jgi:hypothetical protein
VLSLLVILGVRAAHHDPGTSREKGRKMEGGGGGQGVDGKG